MPTITFLTPAQKALRAELSIMAYKLQQEIKAGIFPHAPPYVNIGALLSAPAQPDTLPPLDIPDLEVVEPEPTPLAAPVASEIQYNEQQLAAIRACVDFDNQDVVLIGPAGTGKTTTEFGIVSALTKLLPAFGGVSKTVPANAPAIVVTCPTNRGLHPIKRTIGKLIPHSICTNHRLQEYEPVFSEIWDEEKGMMRKTMRFEPMRNEDNPMPEMLFHIKDESGLLSVQMDQQDRAALPNARRLYVGDIYQLPPIYGTSILGHQLARAARGEIPCIELTQVYRQALDSPILARATDVKNGNCKDFLATNCKKKWRQESSSGTLVFTPIPDSLAPQLPRGSDEASAVDREAGIAHICRVFGTSFQKSYLRGEYDPDEDVILIPHRKPHTFGAWQLNRYVAQAITEKNELEVQEVIAGFNKYYFCVGDRVTDGKIEATITRIMPNLKYFGRKPRPASKTINRWGHQLAGTEAGSEYDDMDVTSLAPNMSNEEIDAFLTQDTGEDRKTAASHTLYLTIAGVDSEVPVSSAAEINALSFAYVLTYHQSQGSEFRRVYMILHSLHSGMYSRELLYTGMTRAKEYCEIIARPQALELCVNRAIIKGVTLAEKAEFFKGKLEASEREMQ